MDKADKVVEYNDNGIGMDEPEIEVDDNSMDNNEVETKVLQQENIEIETQNKGTVGNNAESIALSTTSSNTNMNKNKGNEATTTSTIAKNSTTTKPSINFGQEPPAGSIYPKEESFFSTCPLNIIDEVYNKVDDYLNDAFDDIERRLVLNAATISIDKLENLVQEARNGDASGKNNSSTNSLGGLKATLPSSVQAILTNHLKLNVDNIASISFEKALNVIKLLGLSDIITIDDLAKEDVDTCQGIREKLDHVLDKVNVIYDKNFDKFEMYSLRNIFRIPDDLGNEAKVGIDIEDSSGTENVDNSKTYSEADEKNIDEERYQLLQQIISLRRENKRFARKFTY
jgi:hypothetical protein